MEVDWNESRAKRALVLSVLCPYGLGFMTFAVDLAVAPALWLALLSGLLGGLSFGRSARTRFLYCLPSVAQALISVVLALLVVRGHESVLGIEITISALIAAVIAIPIWNYAHARLWLADDRSTHQDERRR